MSMTKEEIIQEYEGAVVANGLAAAAGNEEAVKSYELFKAGLDALRPVSWERVEKVWRGEWMNFYNDFSTAECSKCGELFDVSDTDEKLKVLFDAFKKYYRFCPNCGAPMTDKAVDMVMERLEALRDE